MANYHDTSISKTRKITGYVMSILFSVQIIMAGAMKLFLATPIVENMNAITNWGDKTFFVGILEIIILALYWIPKTQKIGFYLLCSFVGGIIVAEVVAGTILRFPKLLK